MFALSDDGGAKCLSVDSSSPKTLSLPTHTFPVFKHRIYKEKKKKTIKKMKHYCQHLNCGLLQDVSRGESGFKKKHLSTYEDESED